MLEGNIFITGGAGTLGSAIIKRAHDNNWPCKITIYSTDTMKHALVKRSWPKVRCVVGDIRNYTTLTHAMYGHDIVIHAAAVKHIPVSEHRCLDTIDVNVNGSINVAEACKETGVRTAVAISTDKACHPANLYGASKMAMEKIWQEYVRDVGHFCHYKLVRYGNVLESTGSVINIWREQLANGKPIGFTDPLMTRFWISPDQAVDYVLWAFDEADGVIVVPKMRALSVMEMAECVFDDIGDNFEIIGLRPGEKIHETLVTADEMRFVLDEEDYFAVMPSTWKKVDELQIDRPYTSQNAPRLMKEEFLEMLNEHPSVS